MIEHGWESGLWMSRAVIANAPANLLRKAVDDLMKAAWVKDTPCIEIDEVFDRLVQVSTIGTYTPSQIANDIVHNAVKLADDILSDEEKELLEQMERDLENLPGMTDEELKRWAEKDYPEKGEHDE